MREVMIRAHELAKQIQLGTYKTKIAQGLRQAWAEWRGEKMLEKIKSMSTEELEALKAKIDEELKARQPKKEYAVYHHGCMNSANHHKNKYKHWAKLVTSIDTTKANGYAFGGEFLNINVEHKVPVGSIVVEVCGNDIEAYRITANGKVLIDSAKTNAMSALIDKLATMVA
jgi:hypothetical protein